MRECPERRDGTVPVHSGRDHVGSSAFFLGGMVASPIGKARWGGDAHKTLPTIKKVSVFARLKYSHRLSAEDGPKISLHFVDLVFSFLKNSSPNAHTHIQHCTRYRTALQYCIVLKCSSLLFFVYRIPYRTVEKKRYKRGYPGAG